MISKRAVQNAPFALPKNPCTGYEKHMKSACKSCTQMEELSIVVIAIPQQSVMER